MSNNIDINKLPRLMNGDKLVSVPNPNQFTFNPQGINPNALRYNVNTRPIDFSGIVQVDQFRQQMGQRQQEFLQKTLADREALNIARGTAKQKVAQDLIKNYSVDTKNIAKNLGLDRKFARDREILNQIDDLVNDHTKMQTDLSLRYKQTPEILNSELASNKAALLDALDNIPGIKKQQELNAKIALGQSFSKTDGISKIRYSSELMDAITYKNNLDPNADYDSNRLNINNFQDTSGVTLAQIAGYAESAYTTKNKVIVEGGSNLSVPYLEEAAPEEISAMKARAVEAIKNDPDFLTIIGNRTPEQYVEDEFNSFRSTKENALGRPMNLGKSTGGSNSNSNSSNNSSTTTGTGQGETPSTSSIAGKDITIDSRGRVRLGSTRLGNTIEENGKTYVVIEKGSNTVADVLRDNGILSESVIEFFQRGTDDIVDLPNVIKGAFERNDKIFVPLDGTTQQPSEQGQQTATPTQQDQNPPAQSNTNQSTSTEVPTLKDPLEGNENSFYKNLIPPTASQQQTSQPTQDQSTSATPQQSTDVPVEQQTRQQNRTPQEIGATAQTGVSSNSEGVVQITPVNATVPVEVDTRKMRKDIADRISQPEPIESAQIKELVLDNREISAPEVSALVFKAKDSIEEPTVIKGISVRSIPLENISDSIPNAKLVSFFPNQSPIVVDEKVVLDKLVSETNTNYEEVKSQILENNTSDIPQEARYLVEADPVFSDSTPKGAKPTLEQVSIEPAEYSTANAFSEDVKERQLGYKKIGLINSVDGIEGRNTKRAEVIFNKIQGSLGQPLQEIQHDGKIGTCSIYHCAEYNSEIGATISGMSRKEYQDKYGSVGDAWNRFYYMERSGGKTKDVNSWDEFKIGDVVQLERGRFSGKDESYDKAKDNSNNKSGGNQHIGTIVGVDSKGTPLVAHNFHGEIYIEPINSIDKAYKYEATKVLEPNDNLITGGINMVSRLFN